MKRSFALLPLAMALLFPAVAFAKPVVNAPTPLTATVGVPVNFTAIVNSQTALQYCSLWVDLEEVGHMNISGNSASLSYTFSSGGSRIAFVYCKDTSNGAANSAYSSIFVSGATQSSAPLSTPSNPTPAPAPAPTQTPVYTPPVNQTPITYPVAPVVTTAPSPDAYKLMKIACPLNASSDNPCHAVYYIGTDGKRHAFPNSRVFFTWYGGFDSVQEVSQDRLSAFALGNNVTYRPGVKMVKFTTVNKVYAVSQNGTLRWITSEDLARAFYGPDWNKQIDDIPDSFYSNYTFGADITSVSDFNPAAETVNSKNSS